MVSISVTPFSLAGLLMALSSHPLLKWNPYLLNQE
jgi:hypothetical protein